MIIPNTYLWVQKTLWKFELRQESMATRLIWTHNTILWPWFTTFWIFEMFVFFLHFLKKTVITVFEHCSLGPSSVEWLPKVANTFFCTKYNIKIIYNYYDYLFFMKSHSLCIFHFIFKIMYTNFGNLQNKAGATTWH